MAILQEVRIAARTLLKRPGFTIIAVLALALGSGANTALFSVVNAVLLKPLPYRDPGGLVRIYETFVTSAGPGTGTVSGANLRDWREQNRSFEPLGAYAYQSSNLQDVSEPERLSVIAISSSLLSSLGVNPLMGRTLTPADDRADAPEVALLSSGLWKRRFGADPNIVGKTITLDGLPVSVAGVMPPAFEFPPGASLVELWVPFRLTPEQWANRSSHQYFALGRLKPGVSIEMASTDLKQIAARLAKLYPSNQEGRSVLLRSLHEDVSGNVRPALLTLMGAVGFVLLIACANVANLMLARAAGRTREVAVRIALGASRARLIRQLVVESVLLSLAGGAAGILLAYNALPLLAAMGANQLPHTALVIDPAVLLFTLLVCLVTGVAFGLAPALAALRPHILDNLKQGGRGSVGVQNRVFRNGLIAGEFALALVLLIGAALLIKSFLVLNSTASGLRPDNVITSRIAIPASRYPQGSVSRLFYQPVLERLEAIPGVRAAGFISRLPLQEWGMNGDFAIEGRPTTEPGKKPLAEYRMITPGYFRALGIPMLRGRDFSIRDTPASRL